MAHRTSAPLTRDGAAAWSAPGGDPTTAQIRWEIDRTRADMSRTVNEIEERLAPSHVKEQVLEQLHDAKERLKSEVMADLDEAKAKVKETIDEAKTAVHDATVGRVESMVSQAKNTMTDAGSSLVETIKANPIPAAMVAVGIGWLLASGRGSGASRRRRSGARAAVRSEEDLGEYGYGYGPPSLSRAVDRGESIDFDRAAGVGERAARKARRVARKTGDEVRRAERSVIAGFDDNPLAIGAVALALGAAVGAALPHTRGEDELLGKVRDRLVDRVEGVAREAIGKAEVAAERASEALGEPVTTSGANGQARGG